MEIKRLEGAVEAILFAMGESVELGQIAKAIQQDKPTTEKLLHNLMDDTFDLCRILRLCRSIPVGTGKAACEVLLGRFHGTMHHRKCTSAKS